MAKNTTAERAIVEVCERDPNANILHKPPLWEKPRTLRERGPGSSSRRGECGNRVLWTSLSNVITSTRFLELKTKPKKKNCKHKYKEYVKVLSKLRYRTLPNQTKHSRFGLVWQRVVPN